MKQAPFLDDPRDLLTQHVALAVASPIEEVRAFHIGAAQHQAEIARGSGLALGPRDEREDDAGHRRQRRARRVIAVGFACLVVAVLGMIALGIALLRS